MPRGMPSEKCKGLNTVSSGQFARTELQIGKDNLDRLCSSRVAVFGIGGVGGYCVEALARMGIGALDLFDGDVVCESNKNRQIIALSSTVGKYKVDVMADRIAEINSDCEVKVYRSYYLPENADEIDLSVYDYCVDAVDMVTAKIELVVRCKQAGTPIISCMGAANKLDPAEFIVTDIFNTEIDPLARILRKELRVRGIDELKVVYSKEKPLSPPDAAGSNTGKGEHSPETKETCQLRRQVPSSNSFVPPVAGFIAAGEVIKHLIDLTVIT